MVQELGIGGCERDLSKLARTLNRDCFTPLVGCFRQEGIRGDELRTARIPIHEFPVRSFRSLSTFGVARKLRSFLRQNHVGVVHCLDTPTDIFALPVARMAGVPAVVGSRLWNMNAVPLLDRTLTRISERWAHTIVVNARSTGLLVEQEGVSKDRIYLCYNGVETDIFHPRGRTRVPPVADAEFVIGSVCALRPEKRLDLLIDAFAAVHPMQPGMRLLIVGSGPMEQAWKQRVADHGLEAHCHFEPTRSDVADWMRSIDVFVAPSESESFPNALLEAMACGCAVIGSNVGGIPEMIDPENAGQVFEPGNLADLKSKLELVITNPDRRAAWGAAAAKRAETGFSMQRTTQRMEHLYTSLLQPSGIRPKLNGFDLVEQPAEKPRNFVTKS